MTDWRLENKTVEITRYGGWGFPSCNKTLSDALAWFTKYGYKAQAAWDLWNIGKTEKIGRQIKYRKPNCRTEYTMTIRY